jgi:hypothetical protein
MANEYFVHQQIDSNGGSVPYGCRQQSTAAFVVLMSHLGQAKCMPNRMQQSS